MIKDFKLTNNEYVGVETDNNLELTVKALLPLKEKYNNNEKTANTWELVDVHMDLCPYQPYLNIFDRPYNYDYLERETKWYMSQDRSIRKWMDDVKIWQWCASKDSKREINSNYGWCVFSEENGNQYENCLQKLKSDINTREALMIYTRPTMHTDAVENGKHDFMCTISAQAMIRNNKLEYIATQRSCDICTGLAYDFPWHCLVYQMLYSELKETYPELQVGLIHYNIASLHIYERNEKSIKEWNLSKDV